MTETYRAYCLNCGWSGRSVDNLRDADLDGATHELMAPTDVIRDHHPTTIKETR